MQVKILTENNFLPDQYGKYADPKLKYQGFPVVSFPFSISDAPEDTKTFALTFLDYDAVPVSGFTWIHWLAANIPTTITDIPENASRDNPFSMLQGNNSNAGSLVGENDPIITRHYTGPNPPNKDHTYTLTVYALDANLPLENGYWLNDFYRAIEGHVLTKTTVEVLSRK